MRAAQAYTCNVLVPFIADVRKCPQLPTQTPHLLAVAVTGPAAKPRHDIEGLAVAVIWLNLEQGRGHGGAAGSEAAGQRG